MANMWMVRAGNNGMYMDIFKKYNIVAIGWNLGDLSGKSPDEIKQLVSKTYPNDPKPTLDAYSNQIIKFVFDFQVGDYVISYYPLDKKYVIGQISSDYYYSHFLEEETGDDAYLNFRKVRWLGEVSKDKLNDNTKKNLNAYKTIFHINEEAQENILRVFNQTKDVVPASEISYDDNFDESTRIWLLSTGSSEIADDAWEIFKKNSYIGIDYTFGDNTLDLRNFKNIDEIKEFLDNNGGHNYYLPSTIWKFVNLFKKGDLVVLHKGTTKLAGIGVISSEFIPQTENALKNNLNLNNIRYVDWVITPDDLYMGKNFFATMPLVELHRYNHLWNILLCSISRTDDVLKQKILSFLYSNFNSYFNSINGKNYLENYNHSFAKVRDNWNEISDKFENNEEISDELWDCLTDFNIKYKEGKEVSFKHHLDSFGYDEDELKNAHESFYQTIKKLLNAVDEDEQKAILNEYANSKYSDCFEIGILSSVLHHIDNSFYIIDDASNFTLNTLYWMFGEEQQFNWDINNYIDYNNKYKRFLNKLNNVYKYPNLNIDDFKIFYMFCHWMCDKKFGHYASFNHYSDKEVVKLPVGLLIDKFSGGKKFIIEYLPLSITPELLESKLQGFAISDDIVNRLCASLNAGKHIIINGTPGTGKTELAVRFSKVASENKFIDGHVLTTATSDWSTFDTIGGLMPKEDGSLEFRQGKFLEAIEKNKWLIIDEINRSDIDKAFGQLFTVLSGQDVELPYKQNGKSIKIKNWDENFCKYDEEAATYYIGENWRIIGTMNVDDKDSLFDLSYAFMRRFMFIEVDLPSDEDYKDIIEMWANDLDEEYSRKLIRIYGIVKYRKLGPAIFKDIISYIKERDKIGSPDCNIVLGEAIDSYILPQLEGLNRKTINDIEKFFEEIGLLTYISDKFNDLKLDL